MCCTEAVQNPQLLLIYARHNSQCQISFIEMVSNIMNKCNVTCKEDVQFFNDCDGYIVVCPGCFSLRHPYTSSHGEEKSKGREDDGQQFGLQQ